MKRAILLYDTKSNFSGWGIMAKNLVEGLGAKRNLSLQEFATKQSNNQNALLLSFKFQRYNYFNLLTYFDILKIISKVKWKKVDAIYCLVEPYIPIAYYLSKFYKCNLIITLVGTYCIKPYNTNLQKVYKKAFMEAFKISSISQFTKNKFIDTWGEINYIEVVYLGADSDKFIISADKPKSNYFIFVGTLKQRKGALQTLKAFELFVKKYPEFRLLLVVEKNFGVNRSSLYLHDCFKLINRLKNVEIIGKVPEPRLIELYQGATANILASTNHGTNFEGFGLIHVEANLCGCLTIGGNNTSNSEIISSGINGFLVDGNNINSIVIGMENAQKMVSSMAADSISTLCRKEALKFSWKNYIDWSFKAICN